MKRIRGLTAGIPIWVRASGIITLVLAGVVVTSIVLGGSDIGDRGHGGQTAGMDHSRGSATRGMDHGGGGDAGRMDHGGDTGTMDHSGGS
jgi:hypothetical protein